MTPPSGEGEIKIGGRRRQRLAITLAVAGVALIFGIAGVAIYREQVSPFGTTVLIVDENSVDMEYFIKRVRLSGERPLTMLPQLAVEEVIKVVAPTPPYNISVSQADVDATLAAMAGRESSPSENEFDEWYRQQLNDSGLTDDEYRELVRARLLSGALADYLAERVPSVTEQVRVQMIVHATPGEANETKARLEAGEDFTELAAARNIDDGLKASAGELGWRPRAALPPILARAAFDDLKVGEVGGPIIVGGNRVALVRVTERSDAMAVDPDVLRVIRARVLEDWVAEELGRHHIEYRGFDGGYDSETDAWVMRQLGAQGPASDGAR